MSDHRSAENFEELLASLEQIVCQLEEGRLSLGEAVARYEEGVRCLRGCYSALKTAERKIEILTGVDVNGNPVAKPFNEPEESLEEKQQNRPLKRSRDAVERTDGSQLEGQNEPRIKSRPARGIDTSKELF